MGQKVTRVSLPYKTRLIIVCIKNGYGSRFTINGPEYGHLGTIKRCGPEYGQPGIIIGNFSRKNQQSH